jgi:integron integrase
MVLVIFNGPILFKNYCKEAVMAKSHLMEQVRNTLRVHHYSLRTEHVYLHWIKRFILYHNKRHPRDMGEKDVSDFLTYLAVRKHVSASTQNQALSALLFLYKRVLMIELDWLDDVVRAKRPKHLPVVLSRQQVTQLLSCISGRKQLLAKLLYGTGMRLMEGVRLRIQDINFEYNMITIRGGKGNKDRTTILPSSLVHALKDQIEYSRTLFQQDRDNNTPGVELPFALERKYPNAGKEWPWQWVFPSEKHSKDPRTGIVRRHHIYEKNLQRNIKESARKLGLSQRVTTHTLRHCFATHLLEDGYDIRTLQDLLGHKDVKTTMIYTHVTKKGATGVRSPIDSLQ